jgi:hypothetical protein
MGGVHGPSGTRTENQKQNKDGQAFHETGHFQFAYFAKSNFSQTIIVAEHRNVSLSVDRG